MKTFYTILQISHEIEVLKNTFTTTRLVNPIKNLEYNIDPNTLCFETSEYKCHSIWEREDICKNCISLKALQDKKKYTKFEFINNQIYFVIAKYIKVDDLELVLEILTNIDDSTIIDAKGSNEFVDRITTYNNTIYKDELTGVYNRKFINDRLPFLLNEAKNTNSGMGIALIDLDYFKTINDNHGHLFGDKVLCTIAHFLQTNISQRKGDFIGRFGGDEFLIVLNNIDYNVYIKRLNDILEKSQDISIRDDESNLKLGLSIGGAYSTEITSPTIESIISLADKRLYKSKKNGRNQVSY